MSSFDSKFNHLKLPLIDVQNATNHFAGGNRVRRDGFGYEYKGQLLLSSGQLIDILARRLDDKYGQGIKEFQTEIMMLASLKHPNLVSIVGFCDENGEKIIINKYEAKGSLYQYLSDPITLPWIQRLQICLGIARALSYIHYDQGRTFSVIHRDIKSSKILLDDKWEAKLSGFELATKKLAARRHGLVLDKPYGTLGYTDPTYLRTESVSHKSDMYSLGVVLFEVLTGRKAFSQDNEKGVSLAELAKSHYENETLNEIIHPGLHNQINSKTLKIFSEAAYCCLNEQRAQRPSIDKVIFALDQALKSQLATENSQSVLKERYVEGISTNHWKGKDLEHLKIGYEAIKFATENFDERYLIGSGGYGAVYKAKLEHFDSSAVKGNRESKLLRRRSTVAIKYIFNRENREGEQGFIAEIETLSNCVHPNIVSLLGFCHEPPHMILVYEHVSNGSLDDYLGDQGKMNNFTWVERLKICIGIARGLDYMHTSKGYKPKIIHRDIKSANILLDKNWEAKIADFGLSKYFHPVDHMPSTIIASNIAGTQVYLDPAYEKTHKLKKESDVFSFGVVLFEILCGRLAYDQVYTNEKGKGLAPIAREHFEKGTINEMIDPNLKEEGNFTLSKGPNKDSLNTFLAIGYRCLAEKQGDRPTMKVVIEELEKALNLEETHKDSLRISFEDIKLATKDFNNQIGEGGFGRIYKGETGPIPIAVKRWDGGRYHQGEKEFLTELQVLFEYKHENIIGLVGYCNENNEKILVYEYASNGSLDKHLKDATFTWTQRLKIGIDIAIGLEFLHGGGSPVIHADITSSNILLTGDWNGKIADFGLSMITVMDKEIDFVVNAACGTPGYCDPLVLKQGFFTRESDIYSLGVVLFEMMCGRIAYLKKYEDERRYLGPFVKLYYEEGKADELVFEGIKNKIVPKSLTTFQRIAYQCLSDVREERPSASEVVLQLNKALEFQDIEIWEAKDLTDMFSKGVLLRDGKVCLSVSSDGERNEMVSATTFSYENNSLHKPISIQNSRFQSVVKMMDISNLSIQIKIKTQFLSPNVIYGVHLVFKFCEQRKFTSELMYVNLKYQMGSENLHAYFATCGDDEWMKIELCRFIPHKKDVDFEVLLESLSHYYCGSGAIYVEGIHFQVIDDATLKVKQPEVYEKLKGVQRDLKSNSDSMQQGGLDYHEITQLHDGEKVVYNKKFLLLSSYLGNICHMLQAKTILYESFDVKCFKWKSVAESRFVEAAELLQQQVFQIKCKIEAQKLLPNTNYACHLVFELSKTCDGLQCPMKVRDVILRENQGFKIVYFRSPRLVNFHGNERVPKQREDGLMEVVVWEFSSGNNPRDEDLPMSLSLRCYEGTMSGLIIYGIEFRPI